MKKNIAMVVMTVLILILAITLIATNSEKIMNAIFPGKEQIIEYGDDFSEVAYYDGSSELNVSTIDSDYKLVYYLHADCSSCIEILPIIDRIQSIFSGCNMKTILLWDNEIPKKILSGYDFKSYSLHKTQLDTVYGSVFLIDGANRVIFKENKQLDSLVMKLFDLGIGDSAKLISNTNSYILDNYGYKDADKPLLVYFSMIGCPDCEAVDPIIDSNEICGYYNVIKIFVEKNTTSDKTDLFMDDLKLYKKVYSISWYPSFLLIDTDRYMFVGKTEKEELLQIFRDF